MTVDIVIFGKYLWNNEDIFRLKKKKKERKKIPMGLREEEKCYQDFPGGSVVNSLAANSGDAGSIPDVGRSRMSWSS